MASDVSVGLWQWRDRDRDVAPNLAPPYFSTPFVKGPVPKHSPLSVEWDGALLACTLRDVLLERGKRRDRCVPYRRHYGRVQQIVL